MTPFGAVLLAGGASRRMGADKALLPLGDGRLLWQRQLTVLTALEPAELFISGPPRTGFPVEVRRVEDAVPGLGPLGGIAAALRVLESPLLVVLAIDLPLMTEVFLRTLLSRCKPGRGCVARRGGPGFAEPLAAVYPRECLALAEAQLETPDRSLQTFVRKGEAFLSSYDIAPFELPLFTNWNEPGLSSLPATETVRGA